MVWKGQGRAEGGCGRAYSNSARKPSHKYNHCLLFVYSFTTVIAVRWRWLIPSPRLRYNITALLKLHLCLYVPYQPACVSAPTRCRSRAHERQIGCVPPYITVPVRVVLCSAPPALHRRVHTARIRCMHYILCLRAYLYPLVCACVRCSAGDVRRHVTVAHHGSWSWRLPRCICEYVSTVAVPSLPSARSFFVA